MLPIASVLILPAVKRAACLFIFGKERLLAVSHGDGMLHFAVHKKTVGCIGMCVIADKEAAKPVVKAITGHPLQHGGVKLDASIQMLVRITCMKYIGRIAIPIVIGRHRLSAVFAVKGASEQGQTLGIIILHSWCVA